MGHEMRYRANQSGYAACLCRYCSPPGSPIRRSVKRETRRAVRRSASVEINQQITEMERA
jgi:hypothetical protein